LVLAAFTNGLGGIPGKHARYNLPTTIEDAIRVAVTVEQAETCHPKSDAFYLEEKANEIRDRKGDRRAQTRDRGWRSNSPRKNGQASDSTERLAGGVNRDATCYSYGGRGHYSRVCRTRIAQTRAEDRYAGNEEKSKNRARQGRQPRHKRNEARKATVKPSENYWGEEALTEASQVPPQLVLSTLFRCK
jgi:hypothetical protein